MILRSVKVKHQLIAPQHTLLTLSSDGQSEISMKQFIDVISYFNKYRILLPNFILKIVIYAIRCYKVKNIVPDQQYAIFHNFFVQLRTFTKKL